MNTVCVTGAGRDKSLPADVWLELSVLRATAAAGAATGAEPWDVPGAPSTVIASPADEDDEEVLDDEDEDLEDDDEEDDDEEDDDEGEDDEEEDEDLEDDEDEDDEDEDEDDEEEEDDEDV